MTSTTEKKNARLKGRKCKSPYKTTITVKLGPQNCQSMAKQVASFPYVVFVAMTYNVFNLNRKKSKINVLGIKMFTFVVVLVDKVYL